MKLHIKETTQSLINKNSDILHFSLGIFAGLMVVNTANLFANGALTLLSSITYGAIKSISKFV